MLRLAVALVWLGQANLQNVAHLLPAPGIRVSICGSAALAVLPGVPTRPGKERDCGSACHSLCRRHALAKQSDDQ